MAPHLLDADYILRHAVVTERGQGDPATARRRTAMKLMAYYCGPQVTDDLFSAGRRQGENWSSPRAVMQRESALTQVDLLADQLLDGQPLTPEAIEACLAAIEPYCKGEYPLDVMTLRSMRAASKTTPMFIQHMGRTQCAESQPQAQPAAV